MKELSKNRIWFSSPAQDWQSEALPIGNGRLGAMLFSGIDNEEIQFNEHSFWGGANNYDSGNYDTSVKGFGSYLNFGEINLAFKKSNTVYGVNNVGSSSSSEDILSTIDNNTATKWCIASPGQKVTWQAELAEASPLTSYTFTSANDCPERDPQAWTLYGSNDNENWVSLDSRTLAGPFEQRFMAKVFTFTNTNRYSFYRFVFNVKAGSSHFQIAEIQLNGIALNRSNAGS